MPRNIAFVGLFPYQQFPLAQRLEESDICVHWVIRWRSEAAWLRKRGVPSSQILDTSQFHLSDDVSTAQVEALSGLEFGSAPRITEVILADRHLRRMPRDLSIRYLVRLEESITEFLRSRNIELVTTVNDTALQLLTIAICRRDRLLAVVPARVRLPPNRFGLFTTHTYQHLLHIRDPEEQDFTLAEEFLASFEAGAEKAQFYVTESRLSDLISYLPRQLSFFRRAVGWSVHDRGSRHNRWTTVDLARMYLRKRLNLAWLQATRPYTTEPGPRPFLLYALHMQPESTIDVVGSYFSDQLALIRNLARATPVTHDLYVKIHRGDAAGRRPSFYRELKRIPNVVIVGPEADTRELLRLCDVVFTVSGTIAYEAGLLGKTAVTFSRMYFDALPTVHHCDAPPRVAGLVDDVLRNGAMSTREERIRFLASIYANSFPGEHSLLVGIHPPQQLERLAGVYDLLLNRNGPLEPAPAPQFAANADGRG